MLTNNRLHSVLLLLISVVVGLNGVSAPLQAQSGATEVRAYGIDTSAFPVLCAQISPVDGNGNLIAGLDAESFRVYENGEARLLTEVGTVGVGAQVAVVVDASDSFSLPGITDPSKTRKAEADDIVRDMVASERWLHRNPNLDRIMLIAPTGPTTFEIAEPWTDEYNRIYNTAYGLNLVNDFTPLHRMLVEAMARMKDEPDWEHRAKFILVLSDGVDRTSSSDVLDVINRAQALGVRILTIKIGLAEAKNLDRLALETAGAYAAYSGLDSLAALAQMVSSQGDQYRLCWRSGIHQAGDQSVEVGVQMGGREFRSQPNIITIPVQPLAVLITSPADGTEYRRIAPSWDSDPAIFEPRSAPVAVEVSFPDGFRRDLVHVSYEVDGSIIADLPPDQGFAWDFSHLSEGIHALRAIARDELGMEGVSDPVQVTIVFVRPPEPEPPPPCGPWWRLTCLVEKFTDDPVTLAVLILAVIAVALALFVLITRPKVIRDLATTVTAAVTDPFRRTRGARSRAKAYLVPILDDVGTRGAPKAITKQNTAIGRDPQQADVIYADKSVSRLHAHLIEDADNVFILRDEGSASGTYVNDDQVTDRRQLNSGDVIEFGRQTVIFYLGEIESESDATERFLRARRQGG